MEMKLQKLSKITPKYQTVEIIKIKSGLAVQRSRLISFKMAVNELGDYIVNFVNNDDEYEITTLFITEPDTNDYDA